MIAAVFIVAGAFLYLGAWLTPNKLTATRFVDEFQTSGGLYPGFRRNHAKGVGVSGLFDSNGQGIRLGRSAIFASGQMLVIGRFSLGGTDPFAGDAVGAPRFGAALSPS